MVLNLQNMKVLSVANSDWKTKALQSETDERVLKVLKEGPKSLSQAWMMQAMKFKYSK